MEEELNVDDQCQYFWQWGESPQTSFLGVNSDKGIHYSDTPFLVEN